MVFLGGWEKEGQNVLLLCFSGRVEKKCWPRCLRMEEKGEGTVKGIEVQLP